MPDGLTGKSPIRLSSPFRKKILVLFQPKSLLQRAIPSRLRGRIAIVTDVGYGMRWTRQCQKTNDVARGRRSRVVLTPRRWRQVGGRDFTGDGDNKARSPGRARRKPLKPLRREAGCPVNLWSNSRVFSTREAAGATGTRLSLLPSLGSPAPSDFSRASSFIARTHRAARSRRPILIWRTTCRRSRWIGGHGQQPATDDVGPARAVGNPKVVGDVSSTKRGSLWLRSTIPRRSINTPSIRSRRQGLTKSRLMTLRRVSKRHSRLRTPRVAPSRLDQSLMRRLTDRDGTTDGKSSAASDGFQIAGDRPVGRRRL